MVLTLDPRAEYQVDAMSEANSIKLLDAMETFLSNPDHAIRRREELLESGHARRTHVDLPGFPLLLTKSSIMTL